MGTFVPLSENNLDSLTYYSMFIYKGKHENISQPGKTKIHTGINEGCGFGVGKDVPHGTGTEGR